jgi:hypothetical protein
MMRRLAGLLFLLFVLPCLAAEKATDPTLDELMKKSGMTAQLAQIEPMMQVGVEQARSTTGGMSDADFQKLKLAVSVAYAPERLRLATRKQLAVALTPDDTKQVLAWLSTKLGTRITQLEETANADPVKAQERLAGGSKFVDALPPPRKTRIERFERAVEAVQTNLNVIVDTNIGIARGIALAMPGDAPAIDIDAVVAQIESQRPMLENTLRPQVIASLAMTYQPLSDADLDAYIEFLESPVGRKYVTGSSLALEKALSDAALELGRQMAKKSATQSLTLHLVTSHA